MVAKIKIHIEDEDAKISTAKEKLEKNKPKTPAEKTAPAKKGRVIKEEDVKSEEVVEEKPKKKRKLFVSRKKKMVEDDKANKTEGFVGLENIEEKSASSSKKAKHKTAKEKTDDEIEKRGNFLKIIGNQDRGIVEEIIAESELPQVKSAADFIVAPEDGTTNMPTNEVQSNSIDQGVVQGNQETSNVSIKEPEDMEIDHDSSEISEMEDSEKIPKRSLKVYKNIALAFSLLTFAMVAVIAYSSYRNVRIVIIPDQERISNNMIIDIFDKDKKPNISSGKIEGIVRKVKLEHNDDFDASGEEIIGQEVIGKVTIYNYYNKNQPLVATTRLMSPGNKLYRLKETVNVPAGGSVEVEIYADNPVSDMEIGPTKFTIPGLWAGLQDKIYGENKETIKYQQKVKKHIEQSDIDNAVKTIKQELIKKAKIDLNKEYKEYNQILYTIDDDHVFLDIDGKAKEEKDNFSVSIEANVVVVAFNSELASTLAETKFVNNLPGGKELIEFNRENIIYTLDNFNFVEGSATINTTFEGKVSLKEDDSIIDREKIVGLDNEALDAYLSSLGGISGYEVIFSPSFNKKVPDLVDKIHVEVKR